VKAQAASRTGGVDQLLDRLDGVHIVAHGRWRARCPAHDGANRDVLSIAETGDGTVLVKCFHGCSVTDVVRAVGLELHDLFPALNWRAHGHHVRPVRRPRVDWAALVKAAEVDLLIVKLMLEEIARGELPNEQDRATAGAAATRLYAFIQEARNG
jgi:hypothetical protein